MVQDNVCSGVEGHNKGWQSRSEHPVSQCVAKTLEIHKFILRFYEHKPFQTSHLRADYSTPSNRWNSDFTAPSLIKHEKQLGMNRFLFTFILFLF